MMEIKFWNNLKDSLLTEGKNGYRFQLKQSLLFPRRKQKDYRYGNSYVIRDPFSFFFDNQHVTRVSKGTKEQEYRS